MFRNTFAILRQPTNGFFSYYQAHFILQHAAACCMAFLKQYSFISTPTSHIKLFSNLCIVSGIFTSGLMKLHINQSFGSFWSLSSDLTRLSILMNFVRILSVQKEIDSILHVGMLERQVLAHLEFTQVTYFHWKYSSNI